LKPSVDFIKSIATQAGEILLYYAQGEKDIQHKGRTDLVTVADRASEAYLIGEIRKAFPDHAINAEESGDILGSVDHKWFIDPLDGTLNYAHGIPIYSVSVGYAHKGEMMLGVVYDPVLRECFWAERGGGAYLNEKPIHVSNFVDLIDCLLATGFPNEVWGTPGDNIGNFFHFSQVSQTVRRLGSAALDIAYVAAGRLDGFWSVSIYPWDFAAGALMVQEAGGVVTDVFGVLDVMQKPYSIVCANPIIHQKMLAVLEAVRGDKSQG
jgi:myo-inositol-1(or 4)-monophosphatase